MGIERFLRTWRTDEPAAPAAVSAGNATDSDGLLALLYAEQRAYSDVLERELTAAIAALEQVQPRAPLASAPTLGLGQGGDAVEDLIRTVNGSLRSGTGETGSSLAFSLRDTPLTAETGHLLYGLIATHRQLYDFAIQNFDRCSDATLQAYALPKALLAYSARRHDRAARLIAGALSNADAQVDGLDAADRVLFGQIAGAYGIGAGVAHAVESLLDDPGIDEVSWYRARILEREFARQCEVADALGCDPGLAALTRHAQGKKPTARTREPIRIGLFDYRNPSFPSNNIGDFFQTLGVVAQLRRYRFDRLNGPASLARLLETPATDDPVPVERKVDLVPVSRDFSVAQATKGRIWLPVCGWFAHNLYRTEYGFPFPGNVLPIFMSFHVARPEMIDDEAVAYLKRFEPIGCRDLTTVRLLRDSGVAAFVNGCATLSLAGLDLQRDGPRSGRHLGDYRRRLRLEAGETLIPHLDNETWLRSFDENIDEALRILGIYARAEAVRTPLLHCYLPCRTFGTPVDFIHPNLADPRFEGLVGLEDDELGHLRQRFTEKFGIVMDAILRKAPVREVYKTWRAACADDMARTDALIAAADATVPEIASHIDENAFAGMTPQVFGPDMAAEAVELLFCFDAGFQEHFLPTLESIAANTDRPLSVSVIGRGLRASFFDRCQALFPAIRFTHHDLSDHDYGEVRLLPHISVSTMDRLVAPDLMPDVDRAIYLDVDILVRGDIGALWDTDLGDTAIAARDSIHKEWRNGTSLVYEVAQRFAPQDARDFRRMLFAGGKVRFDAYNAGILVMDFARLRADDFVRKVTAPVERFGVHDQFALNIYTRENRTRLDPAWNHFATQEILEDPRLVHFIGRTKPWTKGAYHAFQSEWQAHAATVAAREAALAEVS